MQKHFRIFSPFGGWGALLLLACLPFVGKAQDYYTIFNLRISFPNTKAGFINVPLDSLKDEAYILVFGGQTDYLARFDIEPAKRDKDFSMFDTPLRMFSHFYLGCSIADSILTINFAARSRKHTPLPKNQENIPIFATCHYLVPKKSLKKGRNIRLQSHEVMEIWCEVAKPSIIQKSPPVIISLDYKAGKRITFFLDSSQKLHQKATDLPQKEITLDLEIQ